MVLITAITAIAWLWAWTCLSSKSHFVSSLTVYTPEYESACPGLKARLSPGATILLPDNPEFANATSRWGDYAKPDITVVVEVATEGDVSETIKYANEHGIDFLAKSGGHGSTDTLGNVKHGIEIWMTKLNTITINPDGVTATIGGGVLNGQVINELWAQGYQTVTGVCTCIGMISPSLGGGHGLLQGQFGLVTDSIVSARLVTASGDIIEVSADSHPDLYWGIRGAGQNFGVVIHLEQKIHAVAPNDSWAYEILYFTHDKEEKFFELANALPLATEEGAGMMGWGAAAVIPSIDPDGATIVYSLLYHGTPAQLAPYAAPFLELGPAVRNSGSDIYPNLPALTGSSDTDPPCDHGGVRMLRPIGLLRYDPPAAAAMLDRFWEYIAEYPAFNRSGLLLEGYGTKGMQDVPLNSTAVPDRQNNLLIGISVEYDTNPALDEQAIAFGLELRDILLNASGLPLHAYVNYAFGDEGEEAWYGYEDWRQAKLKALKKKWDPYGRFDFYNPITL